MGVSKATSIDIIAKRPGGLAMLRSKEAFEAVLSISVGETHPTVFFNIHEDTAKYKTNGSILNRLVGSGYTVEIEQPEMLAIRKMIEHGFRPENISKEELGRYIKNRLFGKGTRLLAKKTYTFLASLGFDIDTEKDFMVVGNNDLGKLLESGDGPGEKY